MGQPPAEADMQRFFGVTPPSIHNRVKTLERLGLITRTPRLRQPIKSSGAGD
jgi:Mn-dependent DtxR family transcriptional regulator